jgi:hypothetical protein
MNKHVLPRIFFRLLFVLCTSNLVAASSTAQLLNQSDFTYVGAFKLPGGNFGSPNGTFDYSSGFVSGSVYNDPVNGKSLFLPGYLSSGYVSTQVSIAQVKIPLNILNPNTVGIDGLTTGTVIQGFDDPSNGKGTLALTGEGFGTPLVYGGKLIGTVAVAYDATCSQTKSAWVGSTNFGQKSQATGPYTFKSPVGARLIAGGYLAVIPPEWQSALGGKVVSGNGPWSIIGCGPAGPTLHVIDADALIAQPSTSTSIASTPLIYYIDNETQATLGHWDSNSPNQIVNGKQVPSITVTDPHGRGTFTIVYNDNSMRVQGVLFADGTRSVLFFGVKGLGPYCYGSGAACNDPIHSSQGDHAYPYSQFVWAYDVNDLIAAKNGQKKPWEVVPYTGWTFKVPYNDGTHSVGVAWDPESRLAYVVAPCSYGQCDPVVHVFRIGYGAGSSVPAPSPAPTMTMSANPRSISSGGSSTLTWSSTNTTSCTASGAWSGTKGTSGSQSTGALTSNSTYSLTCTGGGGTGNQSATVTVTSSPSTAPSSTTNNVSNGSGLQSAIARLTSNSTILLADGTYNIASTLYLPQNISNVTIKGASGNRDAVVIKGPGMTNSSVGFGFWADKVNGVTFQDMTIRDIHEHAIILNGGVDNPVFRNLHIIDIGNQFIKSNPSPDGLNGVDNGVLENSLLEYTSSAPDWYTQGLDVHRGRNWIVRNNTFKNFRAAGTLAGPAILVWNGSSDTIVLRNTFLNNQWDIALGMDPAKPSDGITDHARGLIANNVFYKTSSIAPDVSIAVFDSPQTKVYHNTILVNGGYPNAIEYRFARTTGVDIKNNLADANIVSRDGASGSVGNNVINATASLFVNPPAGDLHLKQTATAAIDKGIAVSLSDDFDGQARPQGVASDIGADEFSSSTTTSLLPTAPGNLIVK